MANHPKSQRVKLMLVAGVRPNFIKIASIVDTIQLFNEQRGKCFDYVLFHRYWNG